MATPEDTSNMAPPSKGGVDPTSDGGANGDHDNSGGVSGHGGVAGMQQQLPPPQQGGLGMPQGQQQQYMDEQQRSFMLNQQQQQRNMQFARAAQQQSQQPYGTGMNSQQQQQQFLFAQQAGIPHHFMMNQQAGAMGGMPGGPHGGGGQHGAGAGGGHPDMYGGGHQGQMGRQAFPGGPPVGGPQFGGYPLPPHAFPPGAMQQQAGAMGMGSAVPQGGMPPGMMGMPHQPPQFGLGDTFGPPGGQLHGGPHGRDHHGGSSKAMKDDKKQASNMPIRSLSAYNFFFRDERTRILNDSQEGDGIDESDPEALERKKKELLEAHLNKDRTKRRPHRKTHGKIGFTSLSKTIGRRWRELPEPKKQFYREIAAMDMDRYQREVAEYNKGRLFQDSNSAGGPTTSQMAAAVVQQHQAAPAPLQQMDPSAPSEDTGDEVGAPSDEVAQLQKEENQENTLSQQGGGAAAVQASTEI